MHRILQVLLPADRKNVLAAFFALFGILASHLLTETVRDALFLAHLPASHLAWAYLGIVIATVVIVPRAVRRWTTREMAAWLLAAAGVHLAFWTVAGGDEEWVFFLLYIWPGVFAALTLTTFWLLLANLFTVTDAKRTYGFIGAGGILGGIAGAGLAHGLSTVLPVEDLLLAAAILLALTALGPVLLIKTAPEDRAAPSVAPPSPRLDLWLRAVLDHPYTLRLGAIVVMATVALRLADYVFKAEVARRVPEAGLATFFADVYLLLNIFSFGTQVLLTGWLVRRAGVLRALWVLPAALLIGSVGMVAVGGITGAILLKSPEGSFKNSLHRTVIEVLFLPLPDSLRRHAKSFIDMVGGRLAQALASLVILGVLALGGDEVWLAVGIAVLAAGCVVLALALRPHYLDLFRKALRDRSIETRLAFPELDVGSLEALIRALNSPDDRQVMAALDLLQHQDLLDLVPALILYHPSTQVQRRALDLLAASQRDDFVPLAERLLDSGVDEVRAAALRALARRTPSYARLRACLEDRSPLMRATATVALTVAGEFDEVVAGRLLGELADTGGPGARLAIAEAIGQQPHPYAANTLIRLATEPDVDVRLAVARAMRAVHSVRFVPALVEMLADRRVRGAARDALVQLGPPAFAWLREALGDLALRPAVRYHLPRTLSLFPARDAAPVLIEHFLRDPSGMVRYKILRGLGRLLVDNPDLRVDRSRLREAIGLTLHEAWQLVHWRVLLVSKAPPGARESAGGMLLLEVLRDRQANAVERLFRLLGLNYPDERFERIFRGLHGDDRSARASSLELLEHLIDADMRDPVMSLVDDRPDAECLPDAAPFYVPEPLSYVQLLGRLIDGRSDTLRAFAAYHTGELGLSELRPRLEAMPPLPGPYGHGVVKRALALLDRAESSRSAP